MCSTGLFDCVDGALLGGEISFQTLLPRIVSVTLATWNFWELIGMSDDARSVEAPFPMSGVLGAAMPDTIEILDVGAMVEGRPRYEALLRQGNCRITGFEVNPERIPEIRAALPEGSQVLPYALGDGTAATLHLTLYRGCSSLFEPNAEVIDMFESISASSESGNFKVVGEVDVETVRLDDVSECPRADYAKLDVQGAELLVLEHGMEKLADAVVVETEVEFVEIYRGQPLFGDIESFMRSKGFVLHKMIDIAGRNFRPISTGNPADAISQFLWADAVFVRDFTKLDRFTPQQFLKAATILHDVYFSYDLAHLFLYAYDAVEDDDRAVAYRDALGRSGGAPRQFASRRLQL